MPLDLEPTVAALLHVLPPGTRRLDLPGSDGLLADWPPDLPAAVRDRVEAALGVTRLRAHQAEAVAGLLAGRHVVVATPPASGKTLVFQLGILTELHRSPGARVLAIYPTCALAREQAARLGSAVAALPGRSGAEVVACDGDASGAERRRAREAGAVVVTTPEMLHLGILPAHTSWAAFLGELRLVIVDELHAYSGVFGAHLAQVLRRLERVRSHHAPGGAPLRFLAASGTLANPAELASRIVGAPVEAVLAEGAPRAPRTLIVAPPADARRDGRATDPDREAREVLTVLRAAGWPTLAFGASRQGVERLVRRLRSSAGRERSLSLAIHAYHAALPAARRRRLEADLHAGQVEALVTTSALEAGVDFRTLRAAVLLGHPGSATAFEQAAGRVGRGGEPAIVVFLPGPLPLDAHLARQPERLLSQRPVAVRCDPDNPWVALAHLRCAAHELPLDVATAGQAGVLQEVLLARRELVQRAGRAYWVGSRPPAPEADLRGGRGEGAVALLAVTPAGGRRRLGALDRVAAVRSAYPGALYLHDGRTYRVRSLDLAAGEARLERARLARTTFPAVETTAERLDPSVITAITGGTLWQAALSLKVAVTGFREVDDLDGTLIDEPELTGVETLEVAEACGVELDTGTVERLRRQGHLPELASPYRGPDWPTQRAAALARDAGQCRSCGAPGRPGRPLHVHHRHPFRAFGYAAGANTLHRSANRLENLLCLCPTCHRRAETGLRVAGVLRRTLTVLHQVAPVLLSCALTDLEPLVARLGDPPAPVACPGLVIAERIPGSGLAGELHARFGEWSRLAAEVVASCPCGEGCPACVGPPDPSGGAARERVLAVLAAVGAS